MFQVNKSIYLCLYSFTRHPRAIRMYYYYSYYYYYISNNVSHRRLLLGYVANDAITAVNIVPKNKSSHRNTNWSLSRPPSLQCLLLFTFVRNEEFVITVTSLVSSKNDPRMRKRGACKKRRGGKKKMERKKQGPLSGLG